MKLPENQEIGEPCDKLLIVKIPAGNLNEGDVVHAYRFIQAPKGGCGFYKTTLQGDSKVRYMYTAEVLE